MTPSRPLPHRMPPLLLALAVTGCASVPPSPAPTGNLDVPARWTAAHPSDGSTAEATATADLDGWWRAFGDAELDSLVEQALLHNLDLALAASRVASADAQARIVGADRMPQVSASLDSRRTKQNFIGLPIPGAEDRILSTTSTNHSLSLSVSWEADLWGRLRAGHRAAILDTRAATYDLESARTSLAAQVARLYFRKAEAERQIELDERTLESRRLTAERIAGRYERGLASPLEVRLTRTQVAAVEAGLAANRQRAEVTTRQLETLLGRYPDGDEPVSILVDDLPPAVPAGLPSELLARRPDLRAAEDRALAAAQRVGQARSALYPSLSLTGSGGTASNMLEDLVDGDFSVWSLASRILQPIFQGGRLRAAVDANEAAHEQALLQWQQLVLQAFAEVETQLVVERRTEERVEALARALEDSREAERLAVDRYLAGLATYLDLLDSQRQAFTAESQWLTALRDRLEARIDLILALGGGFEDPLPEDEFSAEATSPSPTDADTDDSAPL